jgi:uncharacterized protein (DUF427 family)
VSLTTGRGPLSGDPAGRFTAELPAGLVYVEPFPRRVRAVRAGNTVVDSERVVLVHRPGAPPAFAFPRGDVDEVASEAVSEVAGHVHVPWEAVDSWYEEDEEVFGHPRNPYHRVDCVRTTRRLQITCRGLPVVDTTETTGVYETSLAPRLYVSPDDLLTGALVPSATRSYCAYKGTASYWSLVIATHTVPDVAWSYEDPRPESRAIGGLVCFDETKVEVAAELPRWVGETA